MCKDHFSQMKYVQINFWQQMVLEKTIHIGILSKSPVDDRRLRRGK